jgi:hypothetical protein
MDRRLPWSPLAVVALLAAGAMVAQIGVVVVAAVVVAPPMVAPPPWTPSPRAAGRNARCASKLIIRLTTVGTALRRTTCSNIGQSPLWSQASPEGLVFTSE